jgi:uncharacterized membrane protein
MMSETESENGHKGWKAFLRKHWKMAALFVVGAVLALVASVLVFLWFVGDAQSTDMVPMTLGLWTMSNVVTFVLHLVFWELVLIGIPVGIAAVGGWQWWKRLPNEEKKEYHFFSSRSRTTGGSGGISILFFIAFCIKVFIDGNWDVTIASWSLDYVVESMISILIWVAIIFGIPAAIGVILWINYSMKKKQANESSQTTTPA